MASLDADPDELRAAADRYDDAVDTSGADGFRLDAGGDWGDDGLAAAVQAWSSSWEQGASDLVVATHGIGASMRGAAFWLELSDGGVSNVFGGLWNALTGGAS